MNSLYASNGTLLNMKFLLRAFTGPGIHHVRFNVVDHRTPKAAKEHPEEYRNFTIRVAGYTVYGA